MFDGTPDKAIKKEKICGQRDAGYIFLSTHSNIFVKFHSDKEYNYDGFSIQYSLEKGNDVL